MSPFGRDIPTAASLALVSQMERKYENIMTEHRINRNEVYRKYIYVSWLGAGVDDAGNTLKHCCGVMAV
ncbi:hypothetical protein E2C01_060038 [Portunus trituberculatus]|uniref:Uncharacterized protein n=1 Tax=Portunus trituberculatus TaxID=210409 RepID=A0A5B7H154_PORTR|nr:hypothetical protein [Portunus trituberculatus]